MDATYKARRNGERLSGCQSCAGGSRFARRRSRVARETQTADHKLFVFAVRLSIEEPADGRLPPASSPWLRGSVVIRYLRLLR
jgi:hypothetical protein